MCKAKRYKSGKPNSRIDKCMVNLIKFLEKRKYNTLACCCGHGKYPMTIVVEAAPLNFPHELLTGIEIPRKRKFYKRDKQGYYYILELNTIKTEHSHIKTNKES